MSLFADVRVCDLCHRQRNGGRQSGWHCLDVKSSWDEFVRRLQVFRPGIDTVTAIGWPGRKQDAPHLRICVSFQIVTDAQKRPHVCEMCAGEHG
jgi:hypothetical protein